MSVWGQSWLVWGAKSAAYLREAKARKAARILTQYRIRRERELIRRVARDMRIELGMKDSPILKG